MESDTDAHGRRWKKCGHETDESTSGKLHVCYERDLPYPTSQELTLPHGTQFTQRCQSLTTCANHHGTPVPKARLFGFVRVSDDIAEDSMKNIIKQQVVQVQMMISTLFSIAHTYLQKQSVYLVALRFSGYLLRILKEKQITRWLSQMLSRMAHRSPECWETRYSIFLSVVVPL